MAKQAPKKATIPIAEEKQQRTITPLVCPKCGSDKVQIYRSKSRAYPSWVHRDRYYTCQACKHHWRTSVAITEVATTERPTR